MKKNLKQNQKMLLAAIILFLLAPLSSFGAIVASQMYYEIKIYRIDQASQAATIDNYLKDAFIPALHRAGISKVGVFKPVETDTAYGKLIYVFILIKQLISMLTWLLPWIMIRFTSKRGRAFLIPHMIILLCKI